MSPSGRAERLQRRRREILDLHVGLGALAARRRRQLRRELDPHLARRPRRRRRRRGARRGAGSAAGVAAAASAAAAGRGVVERWNLVGGACRRRLCLRLLGLAAASIARRRRPRPRRRRPPPRPAAPPAGRRALRVGIHEAGELRSLRRLLVGLELLEALAAGAVGVHLLAEDVALVLPQLRLLALRRLARRRLGALAALGAPPQPRGARQVGEQPAPQRGLRLDEPEDDLAAAHRRRRCRAVDRAVQVELEEERRRVHRDVVRRRKDVGVGGRRAAARRRDGESRLRLRPRVRRRDGHICAV